VSSRFIRRQGDHDGAGTDKRNEDPRSRSHEPQVLAEVDRRSADRQAGGALDRRSAGKDCEFHVATHRIALGGERDARALHLSTEPIGHCNFPAKLLAMSRAFSGDLRAFALMTTWGQGRRVPDAEAQRPSSDPKAAPREG
jgi:hypothetical protein